MSNKITFPSDCPAIFKTFVAIKPSALITTTLFIYYTKKFDWKNSTNDYLKRYLTLHSSVQIFFKTTLELQILYLQTEFAKVQTRDGISADLFKNSFYKKCRTVPELSIFIWY